MAEGKTDNGDDLVRGTQKEKRKSKGSQNHKSWWFAANPSKRWGEAFFLIYTPFWLTLCLGIIVPFKLYENHKSWWFAANPSKRWGEAFFLIYTPFWLTLCLGIIVPFKLYESFTELEYLIVGLVSILPCFLMPLLLVGKADSGRQLKDRYWIKANLWIIIFSYVGNYFWTHYFFTVLGASYTFPSWRMNNVPHTTFLLTHTCFLFYHMASNMTLRRLRHSIVGLPRPVRFITEAAWILALSYFIAYLETLAISNFPYYDFIDRDIMYKVGSLFYAIYFIVSFPMFSRIDEEDSDKWDLPRVAIDALGAAMLVTIILDLWRIFLGPLVLMPDSKQCNQPGLAWFHMPEKTLNAEL